MSLELCRFRHPPQGAMVIWELTRYCNLQCLHCCTDSSPQVERGDELSTAAVVNAIGEMQTAGITEFFFSGGEPLIRSDFSEIIAAVDKTRAVAFVNTNGYFLDRPLAERLAGTALDRVTISIDGASAEVHARLRLRTDSYTRAVRAVQACLATGIAVRVSHSIAAANVDSLEWFVQEMVDLGVSAIVLNTVFPAGRAGRHSEIMIPPDAIASIQARLFSLRERYSGEGVTIDFSLGNQTAEDVPQGCPAGQRVLYVSSTGDVSGCSWLYKLDPERYRCGSLHRDRFSDLARVLSAQGGQFAGVRGCPLPTLVRR